MRQLSLVALAAALILVYACDPATPPAGDVPTPEEHFGFEIGSDRNLANWDELTAYYEAIANGSPRVIVDTVGTGTRGQPFVLMTITSPENHQRLEEFREMNLQLGDPRQIDGEDELQRLVDEGRTIVLVTNHIHSTEVGSGQMPARTAHRLATSNDPDVLEILDEVILLHVPSLNPDGTQWTSNWWNEWKDTEYEGAPLPFLYHYYVGHNNNRDWYPLVQQETRIAVTEVHNRWRPQIVHDVHQMGGSGARYFVPPYIDPIDPNTDPKLVSALNQLGTYMAAEMTADGKSGIVVNAIYDLYTPARAYQHYHGGVRILSETASADWAAPSYVDPESLGPGREYDAGERSWKYPDPWPGGEWTLGDIVDYQDSGVMALLRNAAKNRRFWLENFHAVMQRAVDGWEEWPAAWIIPAGQENEMGLAEILRVLTTGDVEVHQAQASFAAAGRDFPSGSYVIPMNQPHGSFAQTLLEQPEYPDLRLYPDGPPRRPYDATSWNLPLLMDVEAVRVEDPVDVGLSEPLPITESRHQAPEALLGPDAPRIAYYKGYREVREAGWTRWLFDQTEIEYDTLHHHDVRDGNLGDRYDVILFQDQPRDFLVEGFSPDVIPTPYHGGIGEEGMAELRAFVEGGGRVVAVEQATAFAIETFGLGITNVLSGLPPEDFYIPGSILALDLESAHPLAADGTSRVAWFWSAETRELSRAFGVEDPRVQVLARYGDVLSGWALGPEWVAGQPGLVEASVGEGSVVLFGFQPNYRGHSIASWPLLFESLNVERRD